MRISESESGEITRIIRSRIGDSASVWLFGSRADDDGKGGDIDLYVEIDHEVGAVVKAAANGDLIDALGRKVDLIVNDKTCDLPIYSIAKKSGIRLV